MLRAILLVYYQARIIILKYNVSFANFVFERSVKIILGFLANIYLVNLNSMPVLIYFATLLTYFIFSFEIEFGDSIGLLIYMYKTHRLFQG